MRALSVMQPWASLIVRGVKRFETRGWHTGYRGPIAIHASSRMPASLAIRCGAEPLCSLLRRAGISDWRWLPCGAVLGTVRLADCLRIEEMPPPGADDLLLGDFQAGGWAWRLTDPVPFPVPRPARGRLGLFELALDLCPGPSFARPLRFACGVSLP